MDTMKEQDAMIKNDTAIQSTIDTGFQPLLIKNDRRAKIFIWSVSIIVFLAVAILSKVKLNVDLGFNPHLFAKANAFINFSVTILLLAGLWAIKRKKYLLHKRIMVAAIILSILFLVSYICHHLFAGETKFGDIDHNGIVSLDEKTMAGSLRIVYYFILGTHIPLAGIILPFILFTAYRSLTGEYERHKKLARITWPVWLYVAITGVAVYLMISPYYR
jgi:putative membrane protein